MDNLFYGCYSLILIPDITKWKFNKQIVNLNDIFDKYSNLIESSTNSFNKIDSNSRLETIKSEESFKMLNESFHPKENNQNNNINKINNEILSLANSGLKTKKSQEQYLPNDIYYLLNKFLSYGQIEKEIQYFVTNNIFSIYSKKSLSSSISKTSAIIQINSNMKEKEKEKINVYDTSLYYFTQNNDENNDFYENFYNID